MKETYKYEFNRWQKFVAKLTGMWRINHDSIDFSWGYFSPRFGLTFMVNRGGYFDSHYAIRFCFIWGVFCVKLPFKTRLQEGCDLPRYGFDFHSNSFWFHWGGEFDESIGQMSKARYFCWDLPFVSLDFDSFYYVTKDLKFVKGSSWYKDAIPAYTLTLPYKYTLKSGVEQNVNAKCQIRAMIHYRNLIFKGLSRWLCERVYFLNRILRKPTISVEFDFDSEIGERSGSWKGGVVGCSYEIEDELYFEYLLLHLEHKDRILKQSFVDEIITDTKVRMEKERSFT